MSNWKVLLIGGASGTGKSIVAREIARQTGAAFCEADDIRMALQTITTPAEQPELHFFISSPGVARAGIWHMPAEHLCAGLIGVGRVVSHALEVVVSHHVVRDKPIVIEGDGILPDFAARQVFAGLDPSGGVHAVFLSAPREFFFRHLSPEPDPLAAEQHAQADLNWLYAQWLTAEARRWGLRVLAAQPWEGLVQRILDVV